MKNFKKLQLGLSVIEVIVAITLFSLLSLGFYSFHKDIFALDRIVSEGMFTQNEIQRALKIMSSEIRITSQSNTGAYPLAETSSSSLSFYANIDKDYLKEKVRYFLDGTILKKGIIKPSGNPLTYATNSEVIVNFINNVSNSATSAIFYYYDTNYDGTTNHLSEPFDVSIVRLIKINILIDKNSKISPGPVNFTTQVMMRNLKTYD